MRRAEFLNHTLALCVECMPDHIQGDDDDDKETCTLCSGSFEARPFGNDECIAGCVGGKYFDSIIREQRAVNDPST